MTAVDVRTPAGKASGSVELPAEIFDVQVLPEMRFPAFSGPNPVLDGGNPVWLAPEQVRLVPISEKTIDYARGLLARLRAEGLRAHLDEHSDKLGAKIRRAELDKILKKIAEDGRVSIRTSRHTAVEAARKFAAR